MTKQGIIDYLKNIPLKCENDGLIEDLVARVLLDTDGTYDLYSELQDLDIDVILAFATQVINTFVKNLLSDITRS